jgi:hypothetical protein
MRQGKMKPFIHLYDGTIETITEESKISKAEYLERQRLINHGLPVHDPFPGMADDETVERVVYKKKHALKCKAYIDPLGSQCDASTVIKPGCEIKFRDESFFVTRFENLKNNTGGWVANLEAERVEYSKDSGK